MVLSCFWMRAKQFKSLVMYWSVVEPDEMCHDFLPSSASDLRNVAINYFVFIIHYEVIQESRMQRRTCLSRFAIRCEMALAFFLHRCHHDRGGLKMQEKNNLLAFVQFKILRARWIRGDIIISHHIHPRPWLSKSNYFITIPKSKAPIANSWRQLSRLPCENIGLRKFQSIPVSQLPNFSWSLSYSLWLWYENVLFVVLQNCRSKFLKKYQLYKHDSRQQIRGRFRENGAFHRHYFVVNLALFTWSDGGNPPLFYLR